MKMNPKSILLVVLLVIANWTNAQSITITGKLHTNDGDSIPGASIMLIGAQDSILKTFAVTKKTGAFKLVSVKQGEYVVKASFFGYTPIEQSLTVTEGSSDMDLGTLILMPKTLDAVIVEGHYVPIEFKGDTIEYDSRAFEVKEHDVVEDLLKQLPGVEVEEDGTIKVQGKEVEQVLVDGEKFFGDDATVTTKNLPANAVSKVQYFDKKSDMSEFTGVDDGSESATINIKLKDTHKKGYFGNAQAAGGHQYPLPTPEEFQYEAKANVFSFKKKIQLSVIGMTNNVNKTGFSGKDYYSFMGGAQNLMRGGGDVGGMTFSSGPDDGFLTTNATGVNFTYRPSKQSTFSSSAFFNNFEKVFNKTLERETYFSDRTINTDESADQNSSALSGRGDVFFEQKFDSTHIFSVKVTGDIGQTVYINNNWTNNFADDSVLVSAFTTSLDQTDFNYSINSTAEYRKSFKKDGRFTGADISFSKSNADLTNYLAYQNTLVANGVPSFAYTNQDQFSLETTQAMTALWTWSEPISNRMLLQFDLSARRNSELRNREVMDNVDETQVLNTVLSGDGEFYQMHYNGDIRHKFFAKKGKTTVGARYKYLNFMGADLFAAMQEFHYVLPNATFEWDPNKKTNMRLRYTTSINAPSLNQLQPLLDNTNPSQIILGNTALSPEYNHNVQLRYRNFNQFNFSFFMARITGSYVQNNIIYSQQVNQFNVTELTPENIGTEKSVSAFVMYSTSIHAIKTKFRVSTSSSIANGQINLNGAQDAYTTYSFNPSLRLENIGKRIIDFRTGISLNYSMNTYEANPNFNNDFNNARCDCGNRENQ